jgi:hypothetical protein
MPCVFYMGSENAKIKSAEKSAETGGHPRLYYWLNLMIDNQLYAANLQTSVK